MKYFQENFDDNCYELTVLRWFRDNYVLSEDIEHYYDVAPVIVEAIDQEKNSKKKVLDLRIILIWILVWEIFS